MQDLVRDISKKKHRRVSKRDMNNKKIEHIRKRFEKIYAMYKKSNKSDFRIYWALMDKLTDLYFNKKYPKQNP